MSLFSVWFGDFHSTVPLNRGIALPRQLSLCVQQFPMQHNGIIMCAPIFFLYLNIDDRQGGKQTCGESDNGRNDGVGSERRWPRCKSTFAMEEENEKRKNRKKNSQYFHYIVFLTSPPLPPSHAHPYAHTHLQLLQIYSTPQRSSISLENPRKSP